MIKDALKEYLAKYFECYKNFMGSYPKVPYDEDAVSTLWIGEADDEDYIQWMYKEKTAQTDFSQLENESGIILPDDAKEFYNSYFFLQLQGFYNGENIIFDGISDTGDILQDLKECIFETNGRKYLQMGICGGRDMALCMEIDTAKMVLFDSENEETEPLADSLGQLLRSMTPMQ